MATATLPDLEAQTDARDPESIERLHDRLARELTQDERETRIQCRREARRQGPGLPAEILLDIAAHAEQTEARLRAQLTAAPPLGVAVSLVAARTFSNLRHLALDRIATHERSYRATLLGLREGLDAAHLLRAVAERAFRPQIQALCAELIRLREPMLAKAVDAVDWFADRPAFALH